MTELAKKTVLKNLEFNTSLSDLSCGMIKQIAQTKIYKDMSWI